MHDVEGPMAHDDLFIARQRADQPGDFLRCLDLVADDLRLAASILRRTYVPILASARNQPCRRLGDRVGIPQRRVAPVIDIGDDAPTPSSNGTLRRPAEVTRDLADVGPGAVRLAGALGNVHDRAAQKLDQAVDRLRIAGADVPDLAGLGVSAAARNASAMSVA